MKRPAPRTGPADGAPADRRGVATIAGREPTATETAAAVGELREIAGGRGDLLAEVAGLLIGYYRHTAEEPRARAAAYFCIAAGAEVEADPAVDRGGMLAGGCRAADSAGRIRRTAGV